MAVRQAVRTLRLVALLIRRRLGLGAASRLIARADRIRRADTGLRAVILDHSRRIVAAGDRGVGAALAARQLAAEAWRDRHLRGGDR